MPSPLILLHGTWSPEHGEFLVWAESAFHYRHRPRKQTAQKSIPLHPFLAPLAELGHALGESAAEEATCVLLLPAGPGPKGPRPLPSPNLGVDQPPVPAEGAHLAPWRITGLSLLPADALTWLLTLTEQPWKMLYGAAPDLLFWSQASKLALELVVRQRIVPTLDASQPAALWRPIFTDEAGRQRLAILAEGMPGLSRALLPGKANAERFHPPDALYLVSHFMETTIDALIRTWLSAHELAQWATGAGRATLPTAAEAWLSALQSRWGALPRADGLDNLAEQVRIWLAPAMPDRGRPFRTCFRLDTPPDDAAADAPWTVHVLLQATDDPSLLLPAAQVWRERGSALRYLNRLFDHPQESLLLDLMTAARLFPPLGALLQSAQPESCDLAPADAYRFLLEGAEILQEAGLGVLMPVAWQGNAPLKVRAKVRSPRSATEGGLGLASVLDVDWQLILGDQPLTAAELKRLAHLKVPLVRLRGHWVALDPSRVQALLKRLEGRTGLSLADVLRLTAIGTELDPGVPLDALTVEGAAGEVLDRLTGATRPAEVATPQGLRGELRPYQARGLSWLAFLRSVGVGACLADDMGLGKTIQVIALLLHLKETGQSAGPALLVCPTSLVGNWQRELARFAPGLKAYIHHGSGRLRGEAFAAAAGVHDVVISTYALVHRDLSDLQPIRWDGIVLDEAQNIKNAATRQSRSLRDLTGGYRIALSGTPVENRLAELWSLMRFLNPGYLGSEAEFHRRHAVPIERYHDEEAAARLRRLVQPFILRRVKTDPAIAPELPEKIDLPVYVNLTPEQASLYGAVVEDSLARLEDAEGMDRRGLVLATLAKLKQICNHPAHFLADGSPIGERSGKVNRLLEMLDEMLAAGDRALIFTQYAEMGKLLAGHLTEQFGREVLFLHGEVPSTERACMVERFQSEPDGPPLFILTIKAGGVGLNLTRANHVFHFDRWWNPAVENQATDRAYRIGQQRNVMVHRLMAAGTVEEKIDALIESKRALAEQIVTSGESWLTELSTEQLRELFTLEGEG